ncbi:MAG: capsule assembly Wzi family protein [Saprospiraceae bacterium]
MWLLASCPLLAQTSGIPLQSPSYHILDRLEILSGLKSPIHPELKFFNRRDAAAYALAVDSLASRRLSHRDRADILYLLDDNNEWLPDSSRHLRRTSRRGPLKYFYQTPANFFEVNTPNFRLRANPMLNFHLGREQGDAELVFQNQRGLEVRGEVDRKLFFYTNLVETQVRFPRYVSQRVGESLAVPGAGFFKGYNSELFGIQNGYDFNVATAYLGFQATRHFSIQIGHGKHFIGNGYRSMFLSDFSAPTFFLKLDTRVWRFHYQNLFLELSPVSQVQIPDGVILPKKYAAIHYLNFKVTPRLAFGFFEATVFNRSSQFEFQYLNPVIFYRTVEGMIGSPDNVLLGLDGRWNLARHFQLYGQLMLDELVTSEVFSRSGWWANKWGIQAGAKYVNAFGLDHLDLQLEHNRARPFTYAHYDPANSYTHYNQPLAHPLGANFAETLLLLRWQPLPRLSLQARVLRTRTGDNTPTENWGANPLLDYGSRVRDYGNEIGQGVAAKIDLFGLDASWSLWHNVFADLKFLYRKKDSDDDARDLSTQVFGAGLRMNLWNQNLDF